jgi:rsbT antagonist protein RsbS
MTGEFDGSDIARVPIQPHRGGLIASIQVDLDRRVLQRFQSDLLERIEASRARFVIIDLTAVAVMDAGDFTELRRAVAMVTLMGAPTILCGLRPGVAAALVDLGVPIDGLRTTLNLDAALAQVAAPDAPPRIVDRGHVTTQGPLDGETADGHARDASVHSE